MRDRTDADELFETLHGRLARYDQGHVLRWWPELDGNQRKSLANQLEQIDLELIHRLYRLPDQDEALVPARVQPVPVLRLPESLEDWEREQNANAVGEAALRSGEVALLLVAGGQGTRLGLAGPKGTIPIGPVSGKSLFQIHAEKIVTLTRRHESALPLYVMTSPENDAATRTYFAKHRCFGLEPKDVHFFTQGTMPALDRATGKLLLASKGCLAVSPNGHGGVLAALAQAGHLEAMAKRGIRHLFYFQVDNPLARIADPVFLGSHIRRGAEVSLKVVAKRSPSEKVGIVATYDDRTRIIEYSDLPSELADQRAPDGSLALWAGSIAIHIFAIPFLQRLVGQTGGLPYHRAVKTVPYVGDDGQTVQPSAPNALKFEMFVFDALPLAKQVLVVETRRAEEFEPVKNAEGENSPASARQAMSDLFADWLRRAGVDVPRQANGSAAVPVEISPLVALSGEELRDQLDGIGAITGPFLLEDPAAPPASLAASVERR